MPILPENKSRYPVNWKEIRAGILLECQGRCEFCGLENYTMRDGKKIVLTIAHLDHTPENCARENLRALCQKCHNTYDASHRAQTRKRFMYAKQSNLFELNQEALWIILTR
jgi:5-methylcytosine-specific restriction endonuclease McrA